MRMVRLCGVLVTACLAAAGLTQAQGATTPQAGAPAAPSKGQFHMMPSAAARQWTGDLDVMVKRRMIRVLTTFSKTNYFVNRGTQRGVVYDAFRLFEGDLNKKLKAQHAQRVHFLFVPVARDELIPALLDGRGDLAAANLTITPERLKLVDFANPTWQNVSEIVVTGLFGGAMFNPNFGIEVGYVDLGEYGALWNDGIDYLKYKAEASAFDFAGLGVAPINDQFGFYAKAGLASWNLDAKETSSFGYSSNTSESGMDLMFGVGGQFSLNNVLLRLEFERFTDVGDADTTGQYDVDVIGFSAAYKF